jgi:UDP-glucose 4-epimerase
MMAPVLVLGGNGFIGASLVEALLARGHAVRVLDRGSPRPDVHWDGVDYRRGQLDDAEALSAALRGAGAVFHLVSATVPSTSNQDPVFDVQSNLVPALRLMEAMHTQEVRKLIFFSSGGTVYGNPEVTPVPESHPLHPISSYGVVKAAIERYIAIFAAAGTIRPLVIRPSNPYGPRQSSARGQGVVAAFLDCAAGHRTVRIWGDGETVRDYVHVDDLADFAVGAYEADLTGTFNVGSGHGTTLNELLDVIRRVTGRGIGVEYLPARGFDVRRVVLDISAATRALGWKPRRDLESGISAVWTLVQGKAGEGHDRLV